MRRGAAASPRAGSRSAAENTSGLLVGGAAKSREKASVQGRGRVQATGVIVTYAVARTWKEAVLTLYE